MILAQGELDILLDVTGRRKGKEKTSLWKGEWDFVLDR